jgi:hypothetical protein
MSTDFSIKPAGAPAGQPANNAVTTELPAAQSVTAVGASARARIDADAAGVDVSRQAFFDRAAGSVVYQVVDARTNLVLQQFPDEAVLRRRAYFHALDQAGRIPARVLRTDRLA